MLSRIRSQLPLWRRALRRRRRTLTVLAAALLVAALAPSALAAVLPGTADSMTVVVAASDLPAGVELDSSHVETARVASELVPSPAATSPEQLQGRRLVLDVPAGTALLPGMLEGEAGRSVPDGSFLMAIRAPAALGPHLVAGTSIEILSSTAEPGEARRTRAQVVELVGPEQGAASGLGATAPSETLVLVVVDPMGARDLAHAMHEGWLTITVIG